jgi:hypothetical protein
MGVVDCDGSPVLGKVRWNCRSKVAGRRFRLKNLGRQHDEFPENPTTAIFILIGQLQEAVRIMRSSLLWTCTLLLGASLVCAQVPSAETSPTDNGERPGQTLTVTWEQGLLSVSAHRVPLHRVLTAIAYKTGLAMELAAGADSQLVYIETSPASMRDVLRQILDGGTNYILIGSKTTPGYVERLILSSRGQQPGISGQAAQVAAVQPAIATSEADDFDQEATAPEQALPSNPVSVPTSHEQAPSTALPSVQQNINNQMSAYQNAFNEAAKSGKTRAEILEELQKQQIKDLDAAATQTQPQ